MSPKEEVCLFMSGLAKHFVSTARERSVKNHRLSEPRGILVI